MRHVHWRRVLRGLALGLGAIIALLPALSVSAEWLYDGGLLLSPDLTDEGEDEEEDVRESQTPAVAARGNVVYVVWSSDVDGSNESTRIQLKRSFNGGIGFADDPPIDVSGGTGNATDPAIAVNGSNVYIVWAEDDVPGSEGNPEICFAFSNNGGNTLKKGSKKFKNEAAVPEPCKKTSGAAPSVFNENFNLSNTPKADSVCPAIAVNGSNVYVAWSELAKDGFQVVLTQSTNGGNSFPKAKVVNKTLSGSKEADALCPKLAVSGSILYGVWMEDSLGRFEVAFRQLTGKCKDNKNKVVDCPVKNLSNSQRDSVDPVIAVSGKNIYVAWADKSDGDFDIYFTVSHDGGATFSTPVDVSDDDEDSLKPAIALDGTRVYLAWVSYEDNQGQIKFVRIVNANGGIDVDHEEEILSDPRINARHPALAANASKVFLAWTDDLDEELGDSVSGVSGIFFRFSNESGLMLPPTARSFAPIAPKSVLVAPTFEAGAMRFAVQGATSQALKVEIFSLAGQCVYESDFTQGSALHWNLADRQGRPLANGVYLYVVTVKDTQGNVVRTKLQKLVLLR